MNSFWYFFYKNTDMKKGILLLFAEKISYEFEKWNSELSEKDTQIIYYFLQISTHLR